jgi:hypothetical protein
MFTIVIRILVNLDMIDRVLQMYRESNRKQNGVFRKVILENPNFLFFLFFDLSECSQLCSEFW